MADEKAVRKRGVLETVVMSEEFLPTMNAHGVFLEDFPRYVLPLGEVYRKTKTSGDGTAGASAGFVPTNFFAVMGLSKPSKPLWLMYRYQSIDDSNPKEEAVTDIPWDESRRLVDSGAERDAICLLSDIRKWQTWNGGILCRDKEVEQTFGRTPDETELLKTLFTEPLLSEMKKTLSQL